jgi:peptidoglycan/LPS O-acetylase OafA/YrhL
MPGGFIGVDVFFVISGYLISGIIIKQALKNKFSYTDFYSRRIKRIYPALIAVLIFVLTVSVKKLAQRSVEIMSKTMVASTLFAANIQILTAENDYFDPETQSNPLLHLWSLGVEEQFYIFWPLLLTVIFSKFPKRAFMILSTCTVLSFIISIVCVFNDTQFAFYFPFCRFWQMSVGGLIAYMNSTVKNKILSNILSIASIIAIMTAVWIIDEDSMFPGFWALIPTLGAACIIQAGNESLVNKYILSSKPFVFIGKISYSLYLWHWPLLVFSRILYPEGSDSMLARP